MDRRDGVRFCCALRQIPTHRWGRSPDTQDLGCPGPLQTDATNTCSKHYFDV